MNPNDLITKSDLDTFENKIISFISEEFENLRTNSPSEQKDKLLARSAVMEFLDITENTFKELQKKGLPYIQVGKRAKYQKEEVLAFLKMKKPRINI